MLEALGTNSLASSHHLIPLSSSPLPTPGLLEGFSCSAGWSLLLYGQLVAPTDMPTDRSLRPKLSHEELWAHDSTGSAVQTMPSAPGTPEAQVGNQPGDFTSSLNGALGDSQVRGLFSP